MGASEELICLEVLAGKQPLGSQRRRLEVCAGGERPVVLRVIGPRGGLLAELALGREEAACLLAELSAPEPPRDVETRRSSMIALHRRRGAIQIVQYVEPGRRTLRLKLTPPRRTVPVPIKLAAGEERRLRAALEQALALADGQEPESLQEMALSVLVPQGS